MPALSSKEKATRVIHYLVTSLRNPGPATPFLEYVPKATTAIEKLADMFSTNATPKQQDPSLPTEQHNNTPIAEPTEKPSSPAPTSHAALRVSEQPMYLPADTTPEALRVPEQDTPSPPRVTSPVTTDNVPLPPLPYPPRPTPQVLLTDKINQSIIYKIKSPNPFIVTSMALDLQHTVPSDSNIQDSRGLPIIFSLTSI